MKHRQFCFQIPKKSDFTLLSIMIEMRSFFFHFVFYPVLFFDRIWSMAQIIDKLSKIADIPINRFKNPFPPSKQYQSLPEFNFDYK